MSIEVMSQVWSDAPVNGAELLVLLALADNANKLTRAAFPAVGDLAVRARVTRRTVQRCLRTLQEAGIIVATGTATYGSTVWRFTPPEQWGGRQDVTPRGEPDDRGGSEEGHPDAPEATVAPAAAEGDLEGPPGVSDELAEPVDNPAHEPSGGRKDVAPRGVRMSPQGRQDVTGGGARMSRGGDTGVAPGVTQLCHPNRKDLQTHPPRVGARADGTPSAVDDARQGKAGGDPIVLEATPLVVQLRAQLPAAHLRAFDRPADAACRAQLRRDIGELLIHGCDVEEILGELGARLPDDAVSPAALLLARARDLAGRQPRGGGATPEGRPVGAAQHTPASTGETEVRADAGDLQARVDYAITRIGWALPPGAASAWASHRRLHELRVALRRALERGWTGVQIAEEVAARWPRDTRDSLGLALARLSALVVTESPAETNARHREAAEAEAAEAALRRAQAREESRLLDVAIDALPPDRRASLAAEAVAMWRGPGPPPAPDLSRPALRGLARAILAGAILTGADPGSPGGRP